MLIYLLISVVIVLVFAFIEHFLDRAPVSIKLRNKCRVKDDSILRKIIKFKDREKSPCNYFKIIPIYIYLVILILSVILYAIDLIFGVISSNIPDSIIGYIAGGVMIAYFIYWIAIYTWWGIVDHKELKFSEEEKQELKRLKAERKALKKQNKGNKK